MKNKILISLLACTFGIIGMGNAYTFTGDDLKNINSQKAIISEAGNNNLRKYYTQLDRRHKILKSDDRLGAMSTALRDYSYSIFDSRKTLSKQQNIGKKTKFLDEYKKNISNNIELSLDKCTGRYNTIDNISFANDFPTALTIAIWYRESTCGYYLPSNGYGPFQIMSKNYGTGEITEEVFKQSIQDFIDFAKGKIENYNKKSDDEFPKIDLTYTSFDYTGVVSFAALYNGGTRTGGMVMPNAPKYVFDGYGQDYANAKKYGIYPMFLKLLEWEVDNM